MAGLRKFSEKKRAIALEIISRTGSVQTAAETIGFSHTYLYDKKKTDPEFRADAERAMSAYLDKLEREADRRAVEGIDHPVTYEGRITDHYKEYSDTLLIFRLKKLDPSYRENYRVEHTGADGGPITIKSIDGFDWEKYGVVLGSLGDVPRDAPANGNGKSPHTAHSDPETSGLP